MNLRVQRVQHFLPDPRCSLNLSPLSASSLRLQRIASINQSCISCQAGTAVQLPTGSPTVRDTSPTKSVEASAKPRISCGFHHAWCNAPKYLNFPRFFEQKYTIFRSRVVVQSSAKAQASRAQCVEVAANLRLRSALMRRIARLIERKGWTQAEAAKSRSEAGRRCAIKVRAFPGLRSETWDNHFPAQ